MNTTLIKYCVAALVALAMSSSYLLDSPSEPQSTEDTESALRDALAQAQRERPDLWTPETRGRADRAAGIIARTTRQ